MFEIQSPQHLRAALAAIKEAPKEKQIDLMAALGRRSVFFLAYEILGFKDINVQLHWEMAKNWELDYRSKLFLYPRGTFKTSILTIAGSINKIINNKDIRILISNATLDNAKTIMKGIKDHFIHNEKFRALYPEFCPRFHIKKTIKDFGTLEEFRVPNQRPGIRESTVEIGAVDGNLVSRHYDLHIGDDLVNDKNTTTREQINKVEFFIKAAEALLEPNTGESYLIGTRWHFDDPYGRIIDEHGANSYKVFIRSIQEPDAKGEMQSIFPERFSNKEIKRLRKKMGSFLFATQYLNSPVAEEDQVFKREWVKGYETLPEGFLQHAYIVATVDPAIADTKHADKTAIVTVGVDDKDAMYVLEYVNARLTPGEIANHLFRINRFWKPRRIGIEIFAFQKMLELYIREEMRRRKEYIPLEQLETDTTKSKEMRIRSLQPRLENYPFYVKHDMVDLVDQLLRFPRGKNDDIIDALARTQELLITPGSWTPRVEDPTFCFAALMERRREQSMLGGKIGMHRIFGYGKNKI